MLRCYRTPSASRCSTRCEPCSAPTRSRRAATSCRCRTGSIATGSNESDVCVTIGFVDPSTPFSVDGISIGRETGDAPAPVLAPGRALDLPRRGTTFIREMPGPPDAPTLLLLHGWVATGGLNWFQTFDALGEH